STGCTRTRTASGLAASMSSSMSWSNENHGDALSGSWNAGTRRVVHVTGGATTTVLLRVARRAAVRAGRRLRRRQPHLERAVVSPGDPRARDRAGDGRGVPWRRAGPELLLHRDREAEGGGHHRHPPGQSPPSPDVPVALRA